MMLPMMRETTLMKPNTCLFKVIKKGPDSEPVYNDKYLKTKMKYYKQKLNINFHNDKIAKEGSHCISLSVVLIDPVFKMANNCYP